MKTDVVITSIVGATYLLSTRLAAFRWHELYLGLFTELGNLNIDVRLQKKATAKGLPSVLLRGRWQYKGKCAIPLRRERQNTDAIFRGRLSRSSDEVFVMKMERRA